MLKTLTHKALFLLALLVGGSTAASAAEVTDVLNKALTGVTGSSYSDWSGKKSVSKAVYAGNSAGGNESIQLRSKNNNSGVITTASGGTVKKITVTWNENTADGRTLNVYGKNSAYTAPTDLYSADSQGELLGTIVYGESTKLEISDSYTFIGLRSAADAMYLAEIQITWDGEAGTEPGDDPDVPGDTFDNIAELTANTEAADYNVKLTDAVVTYVNGNYAYIQDASGAVVMYKSGHGFTAGDLLNGTATVTYQVRNGNPQITAIAGVTKTSGTAPEPTEVVASSWNTPINTVLSQYFKVTGATITKSNNKFFIQLGDENVQLYGQGDARTISVSDLSVTYTVLGFPTMYNTTPELQIFVQPEAEGSVKEKADLSFGESTFTAVIGETTEFPELVNPHNLLVTWSSSNTDIATIDEATGVIELLAAGQTTIKADFVGNDQYLTGSASYQLVVKEQEIPGTDKFELVTDASMLAAGDVIILAYIDAENNKAYAMSTTQNTNNRAASAVTVEDDGTIIPSSAIQKISLEEGFYFNVGNGYLYAASSTANSMKTESEKDDNAKASISIDDNNDATIIFQGDNTRKYLRFNLNASNNNPMFSCYAEESSIQTLPRIYRKVIDLNVTITAAGWASVVTPAAVAMPEGVTGYIVTDAANGSVKLAEVSAVPANTPILVQGAAGTYTFNETTTTDAVTGNKLQASDGTIVGDAATIYVLSNEESHGVGFYLLASGTKVPANKCYLEVLSGARSFIGFGDETAINSVKAEVQSSEVFDLQGRRVAQPTKGLYIMNGKKVVIK